MQQKSQKPPYQRRGEMNMAAACGGQAEVLGGWSNHNLRRLWQLIQHEQWKWKNKGEGHGIPRWEEEGVVGPYMMDRKPAGEGYPGVADHHRQERLRKRCKNGGRTMTW